MSLIEEVYEQILYWRPKRKYRAERLYQGDLQNYLQLKLNKHKGGFTRKTISVKEQSARESCDILVNNKIGVELKLTSKGIVPNAKVTRMFDEIIKGRKSHPNGVIIVLVGRIEPEVENYIQRRINKIQTLTNSRSPIKALFEKRYEVLLVNKGY